MDNPSAADLMDAIRDAMDDHTGNFSVTKVVHYHDEHVCVVVDFHGVTLSLQIERKG